ncbi:putative transcription factor B3-Domain family [Helianthus anomalus]
MDYCCQIYYNRLLFVERLSAVVRDIVVEEKDFIVFQVLDTQTFKITHFKTEHISGVNNKFCLEMLFSENYNLWLPKDLMERYFKTDTLDIEFTIRLRSNNMWIVKVNRLWGSNYYIVDFSQITNDLHLIIGDVIVFELVASHVFNICFSTLMESSMLFPRLHLLLVLTNRNKLKKCISLKITY